ncbi:cupredoxin domain-containing protein [Burkholderia pseudomultivorans]|uniref:Amicyanin-alpha n=1 Tax=Burkholderia pseudomultivorans TaxID=1207504 RepID=A0ABU2E817_9BURK|nr:cupredoxin family copper-binding protein [Burkholderia pseudomultivorans]MDR8727119.1 Amicyanin-alpha [Burkholderia pseudomultivorans]MDR8733041.1 Amicyanin-alpha [Burkholderia pseudomultivorans]MDR8739908.1 Amicyanin-alpha [Burkholderia pseudomultivorans]MDR8756010.1 Amicyanin-alpha [Burkholderia pseudomultivorans]MDR8776014.1 Amicyanin-alpha [Burkholderia pseudomultivorans]
MTRTRLLKPLATLALCALAASAPPAAFAQGPDGPLVTIRNFMFSPMSTTIKAGTTITWKNLDAEPHTVVDDAGIFHSKALDQDETFAFRFDKPGIYKVFCGIHPYMKETITVE